MVSSDVKKRDNPKVLYTSTTLIFLEDTNQDEFGTPSMSLDLVGQ